MTESDEALIPLAEADVLVVEAVLQDLRIALDSDLSGLLVVKGESVGVLGVDVSGVLSPIGVSVAALTEELLF
jgi:hypothetical protein